MGGEARFPCSSLDLYIVPCGWFSLCFNSAKILLGGVTCFMLQIYTHVCCEGNNFISLFASPFISSLKTCFTPYPTGYKTLPSIPDYRGTNCLSRTNTWPSHIPWRAWCVGLVGARGFFECVVYISTRRRRCKARTRESLPLFYRPAQHPANTPNTANIAHTAVALGKIRGLPRAKT